MVRWSHAATPMPFNWRFRFFPAFVVVSMVTPSAMAATWASVRNTNPAFSASYSASVMVRLVSSMPASRWRGMSPAVTAASRVPVITRRHAWRRFSLMLSMVTFSNSVTSSRMAATWLMLRSSSSVRALW